MKVYGYTYVLWPILQRNNFYDYLFASLDNEALPKQGS